MTSLLEYRAQAHSAGQPLFVGTLLYTLQEWSRASLQYDAAQLTIVLGVTLAYLYTRDVATVIVIFSAYYFLEYVGFAVIASFVKSVKALEETHVRNLSLLYDPLIAGLALLIAYYVLDGTDIGAPYTVTQARAGQNTLVSTAVLVVVLLTSVPQLYWPSIILMLVTIWICYWSTASPYTLWLAFRASGATLFYSLAFLRPIGETFMSNSLVSVIFAAWFASAAQFLIEQT